jgi:hypothetical protein
MAHTAGYDTGFINAAFTQNYVSEPDAVAPTIGAFDPPQGSTIDENTPVYFEVTDNLGQLGRVFVVAVFDDGVEEVVHDGVNFRGYYQVGCSRVIVTDGWGYTVLRSGGWPSSPTIRVFAVDAEGNEGTA